MNKGVKFTGIPSEEELLSIPGRPGEERLEKGPVAFIECVQEIPCNPCEKACPFGAITVGQPITNLPALDADKCTGCGICIPSCPGLAIFKIHKNYTDTTALVEFPYEYYPLPREGENVFCGDRAGKFITQGKVVKVKNPKAYDGTSVITVEIPKAYCLEVRTICREEDC
ncbi:MAG: 4Fe-4S binding protein [Bacillota bacterium]